MALKPLLRLGLGLLAGAGLGLAWWKLVGCRTGTCPLTATPLRAGLYGAVMGLIWALTSRQP
ncbi:MAG: YtxH domain-containing protein [Holophagaceae bacterium]|nr:YtxH domain-containing protein [Holophagaceae bacterium]